MDVKGKHDAIYGALSASLSRCIVQPFDVIKTNMIQSKVCLRNHNAKEVVTSLIRAEGISGLYKGSIPTLMKVFPQGAIFFYSVGKLKGVLKSIRKTNELSKFDNFVVGAGSRTIATVVLNPVVLIKTMFEHDYISNNNLKTAFNRVMKGKHFFSGLGLTLFRDVPFSGIFFVVYSNLLKIIMKKTNWKKKYSSLPASAIASSFAVVLTHPFDVMRTRIQLHKIEKEIRARNIKILNEEIQFLSGGLSGIRNYFWKGLLPKMINKSLASTCAWTLFEVFQEGRNRRNERSSKVN